MRFSDSSKPFHRRSLLLVLLWFLLSCSVSLCLCRCRYRAGQKSTGIFSGYFFLLSKAHFLFIIILTYQWVCARAPIEHSHIRAQADWWCFDTNMCFCWKTMKKKTQREYSTVQKQKCIHHFVYMQYKNVYTSTKISVPSFPGSMNSPTNDWFPVIFIVKKRVHVHIHTQNAHGVFENNKWI